MAAGGKPVTGADDLFEALASVAADAPLDLTLLRGDEERKVSVGA